MDKTKARLFFFSFSCMLFGLHFLLSKILTNSYQFPWPLLSVGLLFFLPERISTNLAEAMMKLMAPIGKFNSKVIFGLIYYGVLTPIGLLRGEKLDLSFGDSSRETYFQSTEQKNCDFERPY